ncbi:putative phosphoglycerate mutase [Comamonas sp. BIGb0124]|uniref:histidine phosphatase family protein n=1 Tax=Comamonas sp. BIGb0124 TaxID=2485130 RepID=UPI000F4A6994|nr:histidine phosphatase family protein [Comamonas sp. BIGb0124]ROR22651.1 putative phosphoglycerate mutase [Comamonas sp. BIGb0124]
MQFTRLIAVRHGETAWNVDTRIQGHLDIPLNETGLWQAGRVAQALAGEDIQAIYASDLARASQTAAHVAEAKGMPLVHEIGLRERAFGEFQGQTFQDIQHRWPDESVLWRKRDPHFAPPGGGESLVDFGVRILSAVDRLAQQHQGQQILLVAHGGVMDVLYRAATRLDVQAPRSWHLGNAAINRLLWTPDGLTLVGWADTSHLDQGPRDETTA